MVNILSFLPPVKINLITLLNIFARSVTSKEVNFVIFGMKTCSEEIYVDKTKLCITKIPENDILLFSRKSVTVE